MLGRNIYTSSAGKVINHAKNPGTKEAIINTQLLIACLSDNNEV